MAIDDTFVNRPNPHASPAIYLTRTAKLPIRHELIEQDHEAVAVSGLHKVDHFVQDEVFGTFRRLLTMSVLNRMLLRLGLQFHQSPS